MQPTSNNGKNTVQKKATSNKNNDEDEEGSTSSKKRKRESEEESDEEKPKKKKHKSNTNKMLPVDPQCSVASRGHIYVDGDDVWSCMLNQTNIGNNNNKFYMLQLVESNDKKQYWVWMRWGRGKYNPGPRTRTRLTHCSWCQRSIEFDCRRLVKECYGHVRVQVRTLVSSLLLFFITREVD